MSIHAVFVNGRIFTNDPAQPWAREIAVRQGRFEAVGPEGSAQGLVGRGVPCVDLADALVLPGLCDSHIHFVNYALSLQELDLFEVPSLQALKERLGALAATLPPAAWIRGRGWDQNLWPEGRFPTRADLDAAAGSRPVILFAKSGHAAVASSAALQAASLPSGSGSPEGGAIGREPDGTPNGLLYETPAIALVAGQYPEPSPAAVADAALQAQRVLHAWGITSVHDFDGKLGLTTFQRLLQQRQLRLRVVNHIAKEQLDDAIAFGVRGPLGNKWFRIGGLKMFADGALGPRTALMIAPYEGEPDNYGLAVTDKEEMLELALQATEHGIAACVHAIGDRANHDALDVFEAVRRREAELGIPRAARRHRIEHVQVIQAEDMPRLAALDVAGAVQPIHATQDMHLVDAYWGARGATAYAFRSLQARGVRLAFGSDAPVESPNPFVGLHAAVTRRRADGTPGPEGWYPAQRLERAAALRGYTTDAAYLEGMDRITGVIAPGYGADFFVPDRDLLQCAAEELLQASSRLTVVGGQCVHGNLPWERTEDPP